MRTTTRYFVGPFTTVDADTGERVMPSRANRVETAFARGDRYALKNPGRDYKVLDLKGKPVPRPHSKLPTMYLNGHSPAQRYMHFREQIRAGRQAA